MFIFAQSSRSKRTGYEFCGVLNGPITGTFPGRHSEYRPWAMHPIQGLAHSKCRLGLCCAPRKRWAVEEIDALKSNIVFHSEIRCNREQGENRDWLTDYIGSAEHIPESFQRAAELESYAPCDSKFFLPHPDTRVWTPSVRTTPSLSMVWFGDWFSSIEVRVFRKMNRRRRQSPF